MLLKVHSLLGLGIISWAGKVYSTIPNLNSKSLTKLLPVVKLPTKQPGLISGIIVSGFWLIASFSLVLIGLYFNILVLTLFGVALITLSCVGFIFMATAVILSKKILLEQQSSYDYKKTKIEQAEKKWLSSYYCFRDEVIFMNDGSFTKIDQIDYFLFG